ncbi:MAG TPA: hypothetical protein VIG47_06270 [Gemmatimonadaceae bacterium]|jgi:hypothetical protein
MSDRRYDEEETAAIFRVAASGLPMQQQQLSRHEGLTLADLQRIGREVGISPEAVAHASIALDVQRAASQRTYLGIPIALSRTVAIDRELTDSEWERFVVQLREVFHARGATRSDGALRQWTNGNLQVLFEPTETGYQLRFATFNARARSAIGAGLVAIGVTAASAIAVAITGNLGPALPGLASIGIVGIGMVANSALRLPGWARLRGSQMETLATQMARVYGASDQQASLPPVE